MPPIQWNPFAIATHNQVRLPRMVHHATHVALGVMAWLVAWAIVVGLAEQSRGMALSMAIALAAVAAWYEKHVWIDWHRVSGRIFHGWTPNTASVWDWTSDLGLTVLGACVWYWTVDGWRSGLVVVGVYYLLSLVNDP